MENQQQQQTSSWEKFVKIIEEEMKRQEIKKEDKCFCDDCYNYGVVEWKAMEAFVCRDCAKTIIGNANKFIKQWEE